jgi:membrane fusion protein, heavy metal efflux system
MMTMKRRARALALVIGCCVLAACGRPPAERADRAAASDATGDQADTHTDEANTVEVDEGMLRDLRITTRAVESRPGGERVTLLGELAVDQGAYAQVGTPVAARVTRLFANAGDAVRQDQPLVELTSPELARARADYLSATARAGLADAALARKRALVAEKIAPLREVQEAEAVSGEARASLRTAAAAIAAFGVEPPNETAGAAVTASSPVFTLTAPVSGTVIERSAVVGQLLDPASPAFQIGNLSTLWLTVHAFERDAVRIRRGVVAQLSFPALPGQDFAGTVRMVGTQVETESRTVPVRIDVANRGGLLRPGMSATAALPVGDGGAPILTVPVAAVQRVRNEWCVFLPKDAGHFEIRRIGRGRDLAGEVEVLSGLASGEQIVVDGAFLLKAQAEKGEAEHAH